MHIGPPLVADCQPTEAAKPGQGAFHDSAMPAQALAAIHPTSGDPALDSAPGQRLTATWNVVSLVRVELGWTPPGTAAPLPDRRHRVDQLLKDAAVVDVCARETDDERDTTTIGEEVTLRTGPAPVRRIGTGALAPLFAATLALSRQARLQSMAPACPSRSRSTRWSRSQTPASCHSRKRRQQ